ncbi:glycosyltransferase family 2 protein [Candidatus Clostridium radicumherbarum]|uniref:Glycosyltransferase family 2 protein n=1 Tax=Candidatus Clostridium radicumherbarum TaxID=3381662 RepID=A0ABW8TXN5_9CLOT
MNKLINNGKVTIVIPCRNEEKYIANCLDSFINQSYPKELLEVFVCDGMSTDGTRDIVNTYQANYNNIKLLDNFGLTAPKAMNLGISQSNSEYIIIFGAHANAHVDFVKNNIEVLRDKTIGCAGGLLETINNSDKGKAIAYAMSSPFGVGNALFRYANKETYVDTVAFGAYRREVLEEIGYFDDELVRNQDDELNFRVIKAGYKILLSPKIKSRYYSRASLSKLWKQYYQYGFWKVRVMQKHGRTAALRHLVPMIFTIVNVLGFLLSFFSKNILYLWITELIIYFICNIICAAKASKKEYKLIKYISTAFLILHLSYGVGFINGLFNFYVLKSKKVIEKNTKTSR